MVNVLNNYDNLIPELNGKLSEIFNEQAKRRVDKDTGINLFGMSIDPNYANTYQMIPTVGGIKKVAEGQDFPRIQGEQGHKKVTVQSHYAGGFEVTKDMYKFISSKYSSIKSLPKNLTRQAFNHIDQSYADVLNFGFDVTYTDVYGDTVDATCADGAALFSESHTNKVGGTTYSNIILSGTTINPVLDEVSLTNAIIQASRQKDDAGNLSPIETNKLIVGPELKALAEKLTKGKSSMKDNRFKEFTPHYYYQQRKNPVYIYGSKGTGAA